MSENLIDELEREVSHSGTMRAAAEYWMGRAIESERALALAVFAAGGKVEIFHDHLEQAPLIVLSRQYQAHSMSHLLLAKVEISTSNKSKRPVDIEP